MGGSARASDLLGRAHREPPQRVFLLVRARQCSGFPWETPVDILPRHVRNGVIGIGVPKHLCDESRSFIRSEPAASSFVPPSFGGSDGEPQGSPVLARGARYANLFELPPSIGVECDSCCNSHLLEAVMADCSCTSALSFVPSDFSALDTVRFPGTAVGSSPDLRDSCEQVLAALTAVRDVLHLLSDCAAAHSDSTTDMRAESLAVLLRDLSEQLADAEPLIDDMALVAHRHAPDAELSRHIETQGAVVYALRHTLCALYDAIGIRCHERYPIDAEAFAGAAHRMAERLAGVEGRLTALVFSRRAPTAST